jgi:hypothetical protein
MQIINQVVSFEQAPAKWSFWVRCNCISDNMVKLGNETVEIGVFAAQILA